MIHRNIHIHMIHRTILHDSTPMRCLEESNSETESGMVVARSWGRGNGEWFIGIEFHFGKMKKFPRWMVVRVTQKYKCI